MIEIDCQSNGSVLIRCDSVRIREQQWDPATDRGSIVLVYDPAHSEAASPAEIGSHVTSVDQERGTHHPFELAKQEAIRSAIIEHGSKRAAARALHISESTIYRREKKYGYETPLP